MLDNDLNFLSDVVRMQTHPPHQLFHGGTAFDFLIVKLFTIVGQLECQLVRRVVLEDVQNESFLNRLPHGIDVKWSRQIPWTRWFRRIRPTPKQFQRLGLWSRRICDVRDSLIIGPAGHRRDQNIFTADITTVGQFLLFLDGQ